MPFVFPLLFIGLILSENAFAFSPEFHLGFESDFSRNVITPAIFPIVKAGIESSSENHKVDLELKMSAEQVKVNALSAKNVYYESGDDQSSLRFALGRKWIEWSQLDENWGLGASNPLDSWDRLRSFSQGLTGVFFSTESQSLHMDLFGSYLMLPEITPNVIIENNRFEYFHPQSVSAGPQTFNLLNRPTPLGYNLLIPNMSNILLRPSVAVLIKTNKNFYPFFGKAFFGHLPLNYFPIALQASLAIPIDQIVVNLQPRLLSHNLYSGELAYHWDENIGLGLSALTDQIFNEEFIPSDYTTAVLGSTTYWSPWIKLGTLKLSHIYSQGGIAGDIGPYANPNHNLFSSRVLYRNATQLQFDLAEISTKFLHEFSINANWIAMDWKHQWSNHINSFIGGDVISAESMAAIDGGAEFLSDLRALDRIRVGVNYVF